MISSAFRHAPQTVDATAGRAKALRPRADRSDVRRSTGRLRDQSSPVPAQSRIVFRAGVAKAV